ncbi:response regulator transcription factor [Pseudomarimonas arenosa]|uniref:Response regulator transcription factor n=1 Tax=Pseudomarimonas arenosa TaxID=2774145 RepID=A0AAW3ZLN2_9GAMM|nr:response regulator transcription factor [Pseudomarimonas arenosa]MBD8526873.1 response regulator transcription factor [Pseudomarimonas arenosa]
MSILIADDHPLFREALTRAVASALPQSTIHQADSVPALLTAVEQHPDIDLILLDLTMPGAEGFSALIHLRAHHPTLPVLVVSAREEPALMRRALAHGAAGFVPKSAPVETLAEALQQVLEGERWTPPGLDRQGEVEPDELAFGRRIAELTPQQFRVLGMVGTGLLNKQIAYELAVSEATIKAHMTAIMRKLGAHSRTQVAVLVSRLGLDNEARLESPVD